VYGRLAPALPTAVLSLKALISRKQCRPPAKRRRTVVVKGIRKIGGDENVVPSHHVV
jgi:hypothetical protein